MNKLSPGKQKAPQLRMQIENVRKQIQEINKKNIELITQKKLNSQAINRLECQLQNVNLNYEKKERQLQQLRRNLIKETRQKQIAQQKEIMLRIDLKIVMSYAEMFKKSFLQLEQGLHFNQNQIRQYRALSFLQKLKFFDDEYLTETKKKLNFDQQPKVSYNTKHQHIYQDIKQKQIKGGYAQRIKQDSILIEKMKNWPKALYKVFTVDYESELNLYKTQILVLKEEIRILKLQKQALEKKQINYVNLKQLYRNLQDYSKNLQKTIDQKIYAQLAQYPN